MGRQTKTRPLRHARRAGVEVTPDIRGAMLARLARELETRNALGGTCLHCPRLKPRRFARVDESRLGGPPIPVRSAPPPILALANDAGGLPARLAFVFERRRRPGAARG